MFAKRFILILTFAAVLPGCGEWRERWPWRRKEVPITPPSETAPSTDRPDAPASQSDQTDELSTELRALPPADSGVAVSTTHETPFETEASNGQVATDKSEDFQPIAEPQTAALGCPNSTSPRQVNSAAHMGKPMMLENIVPGAKPISPAGPVTVTVDAPESVRSPSLRSAESPIESPSAPPDIFSASPTGPPATAASVSEVAVEARRAHPPLRQIEYGKEELINAPLLQINNEFLSVDDVIEACGAQLAELPRSLGQALFRRRAESVIWAGIQNQITQTLVHSEAANRLTDQQKTYIDKQLDDKLRKMIAEAGGSRKRLEESLASQGKDLQKVLARNRKALTVQAFLQERFYPAIAITRSMLWEYYTDNASQFTTPKKVQMQIVAAPFGRFLPQGPLKPTDAERSEATSRAKKVIREALEAIGSGQDFGQIAQRFSRGPKASQGGIWPMMEAGSFRQKEVEEAAFSLAEGQVSGLIETKQGCYLVKAYRVQPGQKLSFEQAQEKIDHNLRMQQVRKLEGDYIQRLRKRAHVGKTDEFLALAVSQAVDRYWGR